MKLMHCIWTVALLLVSTKGASNGAEGITVFVQNGDQTPQAVDLAPGATVGDLRQTIGPQTGGGRARILFGGTVLGDDAETLADRGVGPEAVVHVLGAVTTRVSVDIILVVGVLPPRQVRTCRGQFNVTGSMLREFVVDLRAQTKKLCDRAIRAFPIYTSPNANYRVALSESLVGGSDDEGQQRQFQDLMELVRDLDPRCRTMSERADDINEILMEEDLAERANLGVSVFEIEATITGMAP